MFTAVVMVVAFVVMEPVTYLTHRFVMHGVGDRVHRSHHRASSCGWEANDVFPLLFSGIAMVATAAAYQGLVSRLVLAVVVGVTAYGVVYALVHDVYIHRRRRWFGARRYAWLERLAAAHRVHHLYGGEPFGMLLPVVPGELRRRAARTTRDPLNRAA